MPWSRIEEAYPDHPKVVGLSDIAFRLHITAICYAARHMTDGHIPSAMVIAWRGRRGLKAAEELVRAGLFESEGQGDGWQVHDFGEYNPSREQTQERRASYASTRRAGGMARAAAASRSGGGRFTSTTTSSPPASTNQHTSTRSPAGAPALPATVPDPSRPVKDVRTTSLPAARVDHEDADRLRDRREGLHHAGGAAVRLAAQLEAGSR